MKDKNPLEVVPYPPKPKWKGSGDKQQKKLYGGAKVKIIGDPKRMEGTLNWRRKMQNKPVEFAKGGVVQHPCRMGKGKK